MRGWHGSPGDRRRGFVEFNPLGAAVLVIVAFGVPFVMTLNEAPRVEQSTSGLAAASPEFAPAGLTLGAAASLPALVKANPSRKAAKRTSPRRSRAVRRVRRAAPAPRPVAQPLQQPRPAATPTPLRQPQPAATAVPGPAPVVRPRRAPSPRPTPAPTFDSVGDAGEFDDSGPA